MHIGQKILELLALKHKTKQELGKAIGLTGSSATYLTTRQTVDVETLHKIGIFLKYNFFKHYPVEEELTGDAGLLMSGAEKSNAELKAKVVAQETIIEGMKREMLLQKQENSYLKKINGLLELQMKK